MFLFGKKKKEEELKTRALSGDAEAQYDYAQSLIAGKGGNLEEALRFFGMAAKQGHAGAADYLRSWYLSDVLNELTMGELETMEPEAHIAELIEYCEQVNAADPSEENESLLAFCVRLRGVLAGNLAKAQAGDGEALYAIAAILAEDGAEEVCSLAGLDGAEDAAREFAEKAQDAGYAPATALLQKLG